MDLKAHYELFKIILTMIELKVGLKLFYETF